jgi:hypothetical protein
MGEELVINIDGVQAFGTVVWSDQGGSRDRVHSLLSVEDEASLQQQVALTRACRPR